MLSFTDRTIEVEGCSWAVPYPVHDARLIDGRVVVLYEHMAGPCDRQFRNLVAFDLSGVEAWVAEHPTNETADVYVDIRKEDPLTVRNFGCYVCEIDLATGKLIKATFTK